VYRLPTEAEWEYAARAGRETAFANGHITGEEECPNLDKIGWYSKNSEGKTHPVAELDPNAWGLYDMHGNVCEWCQDKADYNTAVITDTYRNGVIDPISNKGSNRVNRGGSWNYVAKDCRSAYRLRYLPENRFLSLGFRLAASPPGH
ncbi:MAG: formylglycine-generating enzyme family protein, partial [Desulfobacterales bacterium]|nr:formylglycine-generating enzyme family protein [Desulfobacterales bacterium]